MPPKSRDIWDIYKSSSRMQTCSRSYEPHERLEGGARRSPVSKLYFNKVLSCGALHTAEGCRLVLPLQFMKDHGHNYGNHITMEDSSGRRVWHMRLQNKVVAVAHVISNGWREFSYDHDLKVLDELTFTLVSRSHFRVEFAIPDGPSRTIPCRPMYPRKGGDLYPWMANRSRQECLGHTGCEMSYERICKVDETRKSQSNV